jgi:5-methylcytosine-specific restriction endonuclease McrA
VNKTKLGKKHKEYQKQNPSLFAAISRRWRKNHPLKALAATRKWFAKNPGKYSQHNSLRRARILKSNGHYTVAEWRELKAKYDYTCLRCHKREPEIKLTPDHVKALADGGSNSIDNIQPLCLSCNSSKGAKHIDYRP